MREKNLWDENPYLSLRDIVFTKLRKSILNGEIKPGERIMELQIAARLKVSRTPVREAIHMLEQEGLVITIPRKGATVAKMTEKDMQDVLVVRKALDELAVQLACEQMDEVKLALLKEAMEKFELFTIQKNVVSLAQADMEFHGVIYLAAENKKLMALMNNLREQMYRYRLELLRDESKYPGLIKEHKEIYESLEQRDKEKAKQVIARHVMRQAEFMKNKIQNQV